jgi:hypothetical protein
VNIAVAGMDGGYSGNGIDGNATNGGLEVVQNGLNESEPEGSVSVKEMLRSLTALSQAGDRGRARSCG